MNVEKLKQKILDLAIRGKLVPQDPNDEPASVLIEKIRAEKEALIKQGKIKRDKNESYIFKGDDNSYYEKVGEKTVCIDNEIPFSIPSSWCWQRLCSVCFINPSVNTDDASEVSFVTMKDIQAGFVNSFSSSKTLWKSVKTNFTHFQNEDIGLAKITPCFENRKSVIFKGLINGIGAGTTELNIIRVDQRILLNEYLLYLLKSDYLINYGISKFTGAVGQQRFGGIALKQFLIPIPPFEEQKRLCNTIVGCLQYANSIGKNLSELNKNCNTLKSKILDSFFGEHSRYKSYYENEQKLGEILKYEQPAKYIVNSTNYSYDFATPVLTPGKTFILGYTDEKDGIYKVNGKKVIIFDDFTTASRLVDFDFKVKSSAMKILTVSKSNLYDTEYMYLYLQTIHVNNNTHKRYWISLFSNMIIQVPAIDVQREIVMKIKKIFSIIKMIEQSN